MFESGDASDERVRRRRVLQATGAAVVAGLAGCSGTGPSGTVTPTDDPTMAGTSTATESGVTPSVTVADAETADPSVTVAEAVIDGAGWLVVHPEAAGGGPNGGVTLAERRLDAGTYEDVTLDLDRLLRGDQTLYAMLHYDDPADGEFTFPADGDPAVTADGSPVVVPFTVTGTGDFAPALSVDDQPVDDGRVAVQSATIDEPGWLVVHPEAAGGGPNGGVTLAERQLDAGTYRDLSLDLTESMSESATLYAMLHYDDPADGEFTFPADGDPAVTADGSPVVVPFEARVSGTPSAGETRTVEMVDTSFDPLRLSVSPGTTVEWVNRDGFDHNVRSARFHDTAASWDFSSGNFGRGEAATYTFDSPGVYEYYCTIHGRDVMCGAVLVGDVTLDETLPCETDASEGGGY